RKDLVEYAVNTTANTLPLISVRSLGTEDRLVSKTVAARDDDYEHIIFKASDIKDLMVCETHKPQTLGGLPYDPAIVSVSNRPEPAQSATSSRPNTPSRSYPASVPPSKAPGVGRVLNQPRRGATAQPILGSYQPQRPAYNNQGDNRGYNGPQPLMGRGRGMFQLN
ncbi:hypothetical protein PFISCL1PPCAC_20703, partial [Pristionchus fissidentatus]